MERMEQGVAAAARGGSEWSQRRPAAGVEHPHSLQRLQRTGAGGAPSGGPGPGPIRRRVPWGGLAVLFGVLVLLLSGSRPAQALSFVTSVPAVLSTPGETYVVSNDLFYPGNRAAITITASGVTLDFAGHTLAGTYQVGSIGVLVRGPVFGVSITSTPPGGTIRLFATGIELRGSILGAVQNLAVVNDGVGILVNGGLDNGVASNTVRNDGAGIALKQTFGNLVQQNTVSNNMSFGIWLFLSSSNEILSNTVNNNRSNGILLQGENDNNLILSNTANFNVLGITVYSGSSGNLIGGNTALSNRIFDLFDQNPNCGTNTWFLDVFVKANQACIH